MKLADIVDFQKALGDETRIRILMAIYQHELCLCHLSHIFDLANSTLSKHLDILRRNSFIIKRKQGRFHHFFFNDAYEEQLKWLLKTLSEDKTIKEDLKVIKHMVKNNFEHLPRIHAKQVKS